MRKLAGADHTVDVWQFPGALFERYRCAPGPPESVAPHTHNVYQFCLPTGVACEYHYRGAWHVVPATTLCAIHPGELHATRDAQPRPSGAMYRMVYISPLVVRAAATDMAERPADEPFFHEPILVNHAVVTHFTALCQAVEHGAERLEREERCIAAVCALVAHGPNSTVANRKAGHVRREVRRARDLLEATLDRSVSLDELTAVAGLSAYHLCREFRREMGLPPYAYHLHQRITHAKALLAQHLPIAAVAHEVGFSDQSRFGRHFRRLVGTTPGRYGRSKNRLYAADESSYSGEA